MEFSLIKIAASVQVLPQAKGQVKVLGGAWVKSAAQIQSDIDLILETHSRHAKSLFLDELSM
jgi:hypothetical protein